MADILSNSSIINSPPRGKTAAGGRAQSGGEAIVGGSSESAKAVTPKLANATPGTKRKDKGSTFSPDYGKRSMKSYPITEGELNELFMIGIVVTVCFSLGAGLFGFAVNIYKDLSFNPSLSKEIIDHCDTILISCVLFGVVCVGVGGLVVWFGHTKIARLKNETKFDER